jgi:hypothetical protein
MTEHPTNADLAEIVREFGRSLETLHDDAEALRGEMAEYRVAFESVDRRTTKAIVVGVLVVLVLAITVSVSLVVSRGNAQVIAQIQDCTRPGGDCYREQEARTARNVSQLVSVICDAVPPERRRPPCPPA